MWETNSYFTSAQVCQLHSTNISVLRKTKIEYIVIRNSSFGTVFVEILGRWAVWGQCSSCNIGLWAVAEWFLETNSQVSASSCQLVFSKRKTNSFLLTGVFTAWSLESRLSSCWWVSVPGGQTANYKKVAKLSNILTLYVTRTFSYRFITMNFLQCSESFLRHVLHAICRIWQNLSLYYRILSSELDQHEQQCQRILQGIIKGCFSLNNRNIKWFWDKEIKINKLRQIFIYITSSSDH